MQEIFWFFNLHQISIDGHGLAQSTHPVLELNQRRPVYRNYRLLINGTLFISKAVEADEGKFICEADNGVNEPIGKMVALKINGSSSTSATVATSLIRLCGDDCFFYFSPSEI